jgi:RNA polymerase sigma factor (sigma-70 family)
MEHPHLGDFVANAEEPTVVVIDDDEEIREGLQGLLGSVGLRVELFASVQGFLGSGRPDRPGCLVLDVRLPGRSGLDFHEDLAGANVHMPVIFISGHADVPMSVRAMKAGAVEFLTKPVRHQDLLDAIQRALDQDSIRREDDKAVAELRASLDTLTPREREVMVLVVAGLMNKQIAHEIGVIEATVKVHRGQVMRKMRARSLAELVITADKLKLSRPKVKLS